MKVNKGVFALFTALRCVGAEVITDVRLSFAAGAIIALPLELSMSVITDALFHVVDNVVATSPFLILYPHEDMLNNQAV